MRPTMLAVIPLLAAIAASPATAQINARVHIDIPIGRAQPDVIYDQGYLPPEVTVYDYDRDDFGDWDVDGYYQYWQPVTVYFYLGRYYARPIRGARPFVIYRYGNRYFFPPRDVRWEQRYGRSNNWGHRDYQYRDNGYGRDRGYFDQGMRGRDDQRQYNGGRNYPNQLPQGQYNGGRNYPSQLPQGQYNGGRNYPDQVYRGPDPRNQNDRRQVAPGREQHNQDDRRQAAPGQDQRNQNARGQDGRRQNDRRSPDERGGRSRP
jgi:hypothetical protein